jgi:hypothetical protein
MQGSMFMTCNNIFNYCNCVKYIYIFIYDLHVWKSRNLGDITSTRAVSVHRMFYHSVLLCFSRDDGVSEHWNMLDCNLYLLLRFFSCNLCTSWCDYVYFSNYGVCLEISFLFKCSSHIIYIIMNDQLSAFVFGSCAREISWRLLCQVDFLRFRCQQLIWAYHLQQCHLVPYHYTTSPFWYGNCPDLPTLSQQFRLMVLRFISNQ